MVLRAARRARAERRRAPPLCAGVRLRSDITGCRGCAARVARPARPDVGERPRPNQPRGSSSEPSTRCRAAAGGFGVLAGRRRPCTRIPLNPLNHDPSRPPFDRPRPAAVPEPGESTLKSDGSIFRQFRSSPPAALEPKIGRRSPGARNLPEKYVLGPKTRS